MSDAVVDQFEQVLQRITYKPGWSFVVFRDGDRPVLQVHCTNLYDGTTAWRSRKWFLSPHMTNSEIVQTAFKAVQTAEEHELRKQFKYRSRPIFGPHFDIEKLVDLCEDPEGREYRLHNSEAV